ncbi:low molecular weight protein-tyrosine-phosphatase [Paremcibacter congregatus]|uniref:low molecular weight protein-tyrosine-phosphatase n=1 Tax=Paremcibacter congregatus TaxID=2043170 RepID=UPI0030EF2DDC|tara:strand:- start:2785 stop:3276 length:492 start_codon:yes stop_codon:yes gene_type:complete
MLKVLFVCLGNICRSPTAEGVLRHKLHTAGIRDGYLGNIFIDSAGTGGYHIGEKPDKRSRKTAEKYGVSLEDIRSRKLTLQDFTDYDYILGMDQENIYNMKALAPEEHHHKIRLFMEYGENCPGITEVPDPYSGGLDGFDRVYNIIDRGADGFLKYLTANYDL